MSDPANTGYCSLRQNQTNSVHFRNRLLLTCEGRYVFHIQDFKNHMAQIPTNSSLALSYPCPEGQYDLRFVIDRTLSCPLGADTVGTSEEDPSASPQQYNTIQYTLLAVLPVILIISGVAWYIYKRNKGKKNTGEKSSGSKTEGEKKDDPSVMYDTAQEPRNNNQEETPTPLSAPEDPSVTYSTIVYMKGKRNTAVSLESGGKTEYATIKTGTFS
ncbi:uncharacterized protein [Oncorhynchus clarkii lewisi]|uniref:uncharacterized protein n=1 Tax=Oncorhynchus clarkii lewisi TaxID=490388 RepID=UPI0039B84527